MKFLKKIAIYFIYASIHYKYLIIFLRIMKLKRIIRLIRS